MRKHPAVSKFISDIDARDSRVSLIGTIVSVDQMNYAFDLDDGSGTIKVLCSELYDSGKIVRVIGRVVEKDSTLSINSEIISDFSNFNLELYQKALKLGEKNST